MGLIIGSHVSFYKEKQLLGCVLETIEYGANTFMFYVGAPQNTNRIKIDQNLTDQAHDLMIKNNIDLNNIVVHAPYIINLANNSNPESYDFAISFLKQEINRCEILGINKIILHPGSHVSLGVEKGIENVINALNIVLNDNPNIIICLETMAGKGSEIGSNFNELKMIIDGIKHQDQIGICFDTCHLNDAGYNVSDFDQILAEFDQVIGLNKLKCIHINDSKNEQGNRKDRHENFGFGYIGFDNLLKIVYHKKTEHIPKILETPYITIDDDNKDKAYPPYKFEIEMIKSQKINNDLISDIREYYQNK